MKRLPAAARRALHATRTWLSLPFNAVLALLGLSLIVSLLSVAFGSRLAGTVFFFPEARSRALSRSLGGEYRELPRVRGVEARAGLIAEEYLLGPLEPDHESAFPAGIRVESVLVRKRVAWIDLSEAAALVPKELLGLGLKGLEKSLRASLPLLSRVVVTIGGHEPWAEWPLLAGGLPLAEGGSKIEEKN
jgi:hypothetical protein